MALACGAAVVQAAEDPKPLDRFGVSGGLAVQIGGDASAAVLDLARGGRFLVQIFEADAAKVGALRDQFQSQGLYGLVTVDQVLSGGTLPYAENLIDLVIVASDRVPFSAVEGRRVLRPGGVLAVEKDALSEAALRAAGFENVEVSQRRILGRKPWPAEMDQWTHPRHAADGNPVSHDTLVGPPRRIRWIAGPEREDSRLITAGGRNFYAGLLTRNAFNGLRLWDRALKAGGPALPVSNGDLLLAVSEKKLLALDSATGELVRDYPDAGTPLDLMLAGRTLVTVDGLSVRALEVDTGRLRWKYQALEPRYTVAGDGAVYLLKGSARKGEMTVAVCLDLNGGQVRWQNDDAPWLAKVRNLVYHQGLLVLEVSTLSNDRPGNAIHVVSAADGRLLWSREFVPGMNHMRQARAMFAGDWLWVLEHRRCVALDPRSGEVKREYPAGYCHCFPPVATDRYMLAGEMDLTDLESGQLDANRITKANCSGDFGWEPANGLIYTCPKHCVCWPMLRGYVALAPAPSGREADERVEKPDFPLEKGVGPPQVHAADAADQWPCYRQNPWRSGSTRAAAPASLRPLWTAQLGGWPDGTIAADWRDNPFIRGPLTAPVVAGGLVYAARTDAHQMVALDCRNGSIRWRYTANGRIDTPPTIHRGLCLFGTKSGWVYALQADDGQLVWRLRAAPNEQRIVAYGQVESPWPVPGSVLVVDGVAYFAAGRHSLAEGGILVFAVEPATGTIRWMKRLDTLPTKDFYGSSALEFDNFDLLQQEGDSVAMARWLFRRSDGQMTCKARDAFMRAKTGGSGVMAPRSCWSYAPKNQPRHAKDTPRRGLVAFRDNTLLGCLDDYRTLYRRDFDLDGEEFDSGWITGWAAGENARRDKGYYWLSQRLAEKATWSAPVYTKSESKQKVMAMVLAGETLFAAGSEGGLIALSIVDGKTIGQVELPAPVWDGMAVAGQRLFVSTQDGQLVCLGAK
jgi:outer membrane protein assembly factor BamB